MANHTGTAVWNGGLKDGKGHLATQSGAVDSAFSFRTRFEDDRNGTNPEELIGAALAGCFSMFLSSLLEKAGSPPTRVKTEAKVTLTVKENGPLIERIALTTEAEVPGMEDRDFQNHVQEAKAKCPVSKALQAIPEITVEANLQQG
jgi:osmotically inducible protein OsmC